MKRADNSTRRCDVELIELCMNEGKNIVDVVARIGVERPLVVDAEDVWSFRHV